MKNKIDSRPVGTVCNELSADVTTMLLRASSRLQSYNNYYVALRDEVPVLTKFVDYVDAFEGMDIGLLEFEISNEMTHSGDYIDDPEQRIAYNVERFRSKVLTVLEHPNVPVGPFMFAGYIHFNIILDAIAEIERGLPHE